MALLEKVVDIDLHVGVSERQASRPGDTEGFKRSRLEGLVSLDGLLHEVRPTLVQEGEKSTTVRNNLPNRPLSPESTLIQ